MMFAAYSYAGEGEDYVPATVEGASAICDFIELSFAPFILKKPPLYEAA